MTTDNNYIQHLHAFRGFAILNVVGAHAWSFMIFWTGGLNNDAIPWLFWLTETIFHGSTLYFAIISGVLFSLVLKQKSWRSFYRSKLMYVIAPYLVMSLFLTAYYWQYISQQASIDNSLVGFMKVAANSVIFGKADIHFWYIPVLAVLFLLTPLLKHLTTSHKFIVWGLLLAPLVISRSPFPDFLKVQSFVYFACAYFLGMVVGQYYEDVKAFVSRYWAWLVWAMIVCSCALYALYHHNYQVSGMFSIRQSLVYVQKVIIALLMLYWLSKIEMKLPQWLNSLGSYAFAIFFMHVVFMGFVIQFARSSVEVNRTVATIALYGSLSFLVAIIGSIAVAWTMKKLFKKRSRILIGA
ncbi:hypothetical protein tloyanaT_00430 [Thalassotalea loyana]|uniref:Acyltransferase 3 domain-containing protein n=1 Tax=Thalassotalea loyana TaxID=280483 RepID=A0ABQ6HA60_9GAMM|nr:acyltransferase [Thalassotalea loyana]GLX83791.1 hypothetical protein tloyanaT_00430 [Thalassotalea loyana]